MSRLTALESFQRSIDEFYRDRIEPHGRNIFWSEQVSKPDSILLNDNDYLRLTLDQRINTAQIAEIANTGSGMQMSGVYVHRADHLQKKFEYAMAEFVGAGDAVLCQSGYDANIGLIELLNNSYYAADMKPIFYFDIFAHMSLRKGVDSVNGEIINFRHNNYESLEKAIQKNSSRPGVIVIDSIYSIQGTVAPLKKIEEISKKYGCILVVDESHSLGVYGPNGAGLCRKTGIKPDFISASLAKAFAFQGGIVFCKEKSHSMPFRFTSNPAIFSSVPAPSVSARGLETLSIIQTEEKKRERLQYNSKFIREALINEGYDIGGSESQIIPLVIGTEENTARVRDTLEKLNIYTSIFTRPATTKNRSLIRLSVHSDLTQADLDYLIKVFREKKEILYMLNWSGQKRTVAAKV